MSLAWSQRSTLHSQGCLNKSNLYSLDGTVVLPAQQQSTFTLSATHTSFPSFSVQTWHHRFSPPLQSLKSRLSRRSWQPKRSLTRRVSPTGFRSARCCRENLSYPSSHLSRRLRSILLVCHSFDRQQNKGLSLAKDSGRFSTHPEDYQSTFGSTDQLNHRRERCTSRSTKSWLIFHPLHWIQQHCRGSTFRRGCL